MRKGDHKTTNLFFRRRLYAQTFTIAALCAGNMYWQEDRKKRKEHNKMVEERKAMEKRDRWLRELEIRDEEEKAWNAKMARRTEKREKGITDSVAEKTQELKDKVVGDK
jgi:Flp pilus assembly protein TadB